MATARGKNMFHTDEARIEIIPMIDIMMFLLVFFIMITLEMITNTGIQQELPGNAIPSDLQIVTKLVVGMSPDGRISVNGQDTTREAFVDQLRAAKATEASGAKVEVLIAGDKKVPLQSILGIMDLVRAEKIEAVGIATRKDSDPSKAGKVL